MLIICCHLQANIEQAEQGLPWCDPWLSGSWCDSVALRVVVAVPRPSAGTAVTPFSETFIFPSRLNTRKALEAP